ncbi:MAG: helix-hairpin-helix domain-containing protein [Eubacteriales bacterium]|jgi:DNA uptake protein ComE-like DNA-binding protein|nr:helix-hairpin-helix domain-containing protein [Eubacteriales bacterium]MDD4104345.1 helix-hairpin-helix domain-containing protein [Eubacteriales bacterium]MDD4709708.1 helix-hairpin-helix domain-containing protein [Eubacteriales bacterium]NLO15423.1 helix-hairpin-helix domain-containing protein [Clostridiales bacterium]
MKTARALMALCAVCAVLCVVLVLLSLLPPKWTAVSLLPPIAPFPQAAMPQGDIAVNTADMSELMLLPGVGPVTAAEIQRQRAIQLFFYPEDLLIIRGIALKKLENMRPFISVP